MSSSSNFVICISAVLPMFILLCAGYVTRLTGIVTEELTEKLNSIVFKVTFPFMIFENIYGSDIGDVFSIRLIAFAFAAIALEYIAGTVLTLKIEENQKSRGAMIQAIYRSNFVIMGLPIAMNIYGHGNVGVTAMMIALVVPVYNVLAVTTLEVYRNRKPELKIILINIAKNPLIIGAVAALLCVFFNIKLPGIVESAVSDIGGIATPAALLILGASFKFSSVGRIKRNLTVICLLRLIIIPAIVLTAAYLIGIRDIAFVTLIAIFAAPCAISSYTMAQEMDSDGELAGAGVIFTSAFCSFTMFIILLAFKTIGAF